METSYTAAVAVLAYDKWSASPHMQKHANKNRTHTIYDE